jgi:hypothetical protein
LNSVGGVGAPPASAPTTNFLEGVIEVQTKRIEVRQWPLSLSSKIQTCCSVCLPSFTLVLSPPLLACL